MNNRFLIDEFINCYLLALGIYRWKTDHKESKRNATYIIPDESAEKELYEIFIEHR